ncbi:nucleotide exchange factor GrpE [Streptomyces sp. GS7]|uniref:nucleotide exchange factor GrpE n=1 Tax=Streptomyces sp. GS7 TaxID=2692234 RepID=UPI00131990CE|nr:nucleotide exchange factor GrpE [Streptomyces sp. GS7]QHC23957.1 nucleotide exchange factor GrpE [Streptomyces sp. GS7]
MNRPTDAGHVPRPQLALVGHRPEDRRRGTAASPGPDPAAGRPAPPEARRPTAGGLGTEQPESERLQTELQERTADLQRLKAEFDNYRRRVHRDRLAIGEIAVVNVLAQMLPVLDAIAEAADQGEVTGGFRRVVRVFEAELTALGLRSVAALGDPFDPALHEAVTYTPAARAERAVCDAVLRQGYRVGDRLLRPAEVAVTGEPPAPR